MSVDSPGNAKEIFLSAVEIESQIEREAYLADACGGDDDLRQRVEALIKAHQSPESLLNANAPALASDEVSPTVDYPILEQVGLQIGPYKLREQLGIGGMGVVWAAERKEPIRQKVALKVIKPGMDSKQVLARFDAERESLSLMDHPNIARVLDAGTTAQGRPYFVMELIRGVPMTEYCDSNRLSVRDRLGLFLQVCKAVQHAHQKGVIHRDIKPSNVLVTEHDGQPFVKVIDFGVAKALHNSSADRSIFTGLFQAIGTLPYMSPEQAGLSSSDIDTRADIYSLGVLLYELLTGCTPVSKEKLSSAALEEACRIIREQDPPLPSTRIETRSSKMTPVAKSRNTNSVGLHRMIKGDLDWIVMKALSKKRGDRYSTAIGFAEDVERYLNDEEVTARRPSISNRFWRSIRRNPTLTALSSLTAVVLVALTLLAWSGYRMALKDLEIQQRSKLPLLLDSASALENDSQFVKAAEKYRELVRLNTDIHGPHHLETIRRKSSLARVLGKLNETSESAALFEESLEWLDSANSAEADFIAEDYRDMLVRAADNLLTPLQPNGPNALLAARYAARINELQSQYDLEPDYQSFTVCACAEYAVGEYERADKTCRDWMTSPAHGNTWIAYLILATLEAKKENYRAAKDWVAAADALWIGGGINTYERGTVIRNHAVELLLDAKQPPTEHPTIESKNDLYSRLLLRVPGAFELRKYQGYSLVLLGRWEEANDVFSSLIASGDKDHFTIASKSLLDLYFEKEPNDQTCSQTLYRMSLEVKNQAGGMLAIVSMLGDFDSNQPDRDWPRTVSANNSVAGSFALYKVGLNEIAFRQLNNVGGIVPARDALAEVIKALILWEENRKEEARATLSKAETVMAELAPQEGVARSTVADVGYFSSSVWLETTILMRKAKRIMSEEVATSANM